MFDQIKQWQKGTSSLEVMAALVLFLLAAAGLAVVLPMAYGRAGLWGEQMKLARFLEKQGEAVRALAFDDLPVGDSGWLTDGDVLYKRVISFVRPGVDADARPTWTPQTSLSGDGLSAVYYNNQDLTVPVIRRTDPAIDFNWGHGSPDPAIEPDSFSARWTGYLETNGAGVYTFYADTDDGVRLWVNRQLLLDYWTDPPNREVSAQITLAAHTIYPICMEYYENNRRAQAELSWSGPGIFKTIIPQTNLYSNLAKMTVLTVSNSSGSCAMNGRLLSFDNQENNAAPPSSSRLHVAGITMARIRNGINWSARATVFVRDETGQAISGVTVTGTWSGLVTGTVSGVTGNNGTVTLRSPRTRATGTITFTVTNLDKFGYVYDPSANAVTSASISGPWW